MSDDHVCPICHTKNKVKSIYAIDKRQFPSYSKIQKDDLVDMVKIMRGILSFKLANEMDYFSAIRHYAKDNSMALMYENLSFNASRHRSMSNETLVIHRVFELVGGIDRKCAGCTMSFKNALLLEDINSLNHIEIALTKSIIKLTKNAIKAKK